MDKSQSRAIRDDGYALTYREIAELTGIPKSTVAELERTGMEKLRRGLGIFRKRVQKRPHVKAGGARLR